MTFMPDAVFEVNEPMVISETIDGETIIINLSSGTYYNLKHSGATIWAGIQQSGGLAAIATMLRSRFEVGGEDVEHEISALVERLVAEDLIRPKVGEAAPLTLSATSEGEGRTSFLAPLLDKFTDMEAMLLLDPVHDVDEEGWPRVPVNTGQMDA
jgi:hypothetical protein